MEAIHAQLPLLAWQGVGVAAMSYCGRVHIGLVADHKSVPDVSLLATGLDAAFEELRAL
jgi:hypothetical protein